MIMNIEEQEKRLEDIFRKNNNEGFVVAITGCWGVGKTFFWNNFFKEKTQEEKQIKDNFYYEASRVGFDSAFENKKYAYVSLFGIESMQDLKNAICTKLSTNPYVTESPKRLEFSSLLKKSLEQFKDIKVSQYGVSASAKLLENLLYAQVKDAIICFDDFERLSEKLKIQDVMGLVNQLKLERNCQVILILDESKNDEKNKKKYAQYKEKLIDESIKITSVEPLIREKAKDIDELLVDLMVKFANELKIHNFRFFQKVIRLYKKFSAQLPEEVAYLTKEIILIRVLQGYFIEDFGDDRDFSWSDIKLDLENNQKDWSKNKIKNYETLKKINNYFVYPDLWLDEFKKEFDQQGEPDFSKLHELANSELISENSQNLKKKIWDIFQRRLNLEVIEEDFKYLSTLGKEMVSIETIYNTSVAYELITKYLSHKNYSESFKNDVFGYIESDIGDAISRKKEEIGLWNRPNNIFFDYIDKLTEDYQQKKNLKEIISHFFQYDVFKNEDDKYNLKQFTTDDWFVYFTQDIYKQKFYIEKEKTIVACLRRLIKIQYEDGFELKEVVIGVLEKIGKESEFKRRYTQDIILNHLD